MPKKANPKCKNCKRNGSPHWWNCCDEHTPGNDVVCDYCYHILHPDPDDHESYEV